MDIDAATTAREWVRKLSSNVLCNWEAKQVAIPYVQDLSHTIVQKITKNSHAPYPATKRCSEADREASQLKIRLAELEEQKAIIQSQLAVLEVGTVASNPTTVDMSSASEVKFLRSQASPGKIIGNDWPLSQVEQTHRIIALYEDELSVRSFSIASPRGGWLEGSECASSIVSAATTPCGRMSGRMKSLKGFSADPLHSSKSVSSRTSRKTGGSQHQSKRRIWQSTTAALCPENSSAQRSPGNFEPEEKKKKKISESMPNTPSKRRIWRNSVRGSPG